MLSKPPLRKIPKVERLADRFGDTDPCAGAKLPDLRSPEQRTLYWTLKDLIKKQDSEGMAREIKKHGWLAVAEVMPEEYFFKPPARKPTP